MARWHWLVRVALILLVACSSAPSGPLKAQAVDDKGQPGQAEPGQIRFTQAPDGVIIDHATGLEWYVAPQRDNTWHQAKTWVENLTVAGGGWRMPTVPELQAIYQKGAAPYNMDPLFQAKGVWVWSGQMNNAWSAWGFAFYNGLEGWHSVNYGNGRLAFAVRSRR